MHAHRGHTSTRNIGGANGFVCHLWILIRVVRLITGAHGVETLEKDIVQCPKAPHPFAAKQQAGRDDERVAVDRRHPGRS